MTLENARSRGNVNGELSEVIVIKTGFNYIRRPIVDSIV